MNYRTFLRHHPREAGFALGAAFFSSFGQTFFIALFIPMMALAAAVTEAMMGIIYAGDGAHYPLAHLKTEIDSGGIVRFSDRG